MGKQYGCTPTGCMVLILFVVIVVIGAFIASEAGVRTTPGANVYQWDTPLQSSEGVECEMQRFHVEVLGHPVDDFNRACFR